MLEKVLRMGRLFDLYGKLLTPKQREFMQLYYEEDLSLGEIAAEYGVSRQAVYDNLHRAEGLLEEMESALGVLKDRMRQEMYIEEICRLTACLEERFQADKKVLSLLARIRLLAGRLGSDEGEED